MSNENQQQEKLSDIDVEKYKNSMLSFYKDNMEFLRLKHEHDKLKCEIEEYALRSYLTKIKFAEFKEPKTPDDGGEGN